MKEKDIRPEKLLHRYLELSRKDSELCFADVKRQEILCVGCNNANNSFQFNKNGFHYTRCDSCGSLFQSPRPTIESFEAFYRESVSSVFWAEEFFPAVAEARREQIFKPRVSKISEIFFKKNISIKNIVEVGAGYGIFLQEWEKIHTEANSIAIEPSASLAEECRGKGLQVIENIVENVTVLDNYADLVVCFEVLEHVYAPLVFVKDLLKIARPGGYVFVSTLGIDGFDIQTLWEKSNSIFPPHHINFLSIKGFKHLFTNAGLEEIEILTPGKLDVDIIQNAFNKDPDILKNQRFIQHILSEKSLSESFQKFLVENSLSSHTWIIGRKPKD